MATRPATALDPLADKLRQVHTIPALVQYLHDELGWPVNVEDWEDNLFDWQPDELNLKAEHEVKVKSIKQLRPLVSGQPWGIFFVEFNKGRLPITALRRVLNGLVPKGRATGGGHQTWAAHDLLFVSSFGESNAREIALAHFTDESSKGDLPTLRVLGWDDDDTPMQLGYVAQTLRDKLRWPASTRTPAELQAWRAQWSSAFSLRYGQVINDSKTLALAMAELAKRIRRRVNTVLALESDSGHLRQMHKAFKDNLIADLSEDAFADMFAQTITYGLFTARASRSSGALVADNLADMVPSTNPFLKELLGSFLSAAGRARNRQKRVDFDELGINEVVTVLREVPMDAVLRSFNASKPGDDPVIHFYEDFLKAYDKAMRAKRGVFYTPSPVVQFIVRSVDEILKTEFGIEDGLASTITWGEMMAAKPELKLPKFCTAATPFVQVLDPATGTGTFIVEVITQIHTHMLAKWAKQGKVTKAQWQPLWVEYVKQHLLPRLYAFELMMAPYAIAHMKIGLKLAETGYTFPEDGPRVNVFLTNALEPAHAINPGLEFEAPMLAHEAAAANRVKEQLAATVVVGNPPYAQYSMNLNDAAKAHIEKFRYSNGTKIRARNALQLERNLNDDYVKFLGYSADLLPRGTGVLGMITNRTYLDSESLIGLREWLATNFDQLYVVDLGGSSEETRRVERLASDENVFDILQGVAVSFASQRREQPGAPKSTKSREIIGAREEKYSLLSAGFELGGDGWKDTQPESSNWSLHHVSMPSGNGHDFSIAEIFPQYSTLVASNRDHLVVDFDKETVIRNVKAVQSFSGSNEEWSQKFGITLKTGWNVNVAREKLAAIHDIAAHVLPIEYRAFDRRWIFFHSTLVWQAAPVISNNLANEHINRVLISLGKNRAETTNGHWVASTLSDKSAVSTRDNASGFPLYTLMKEVKGSIGGVVRQPNISKAFLRHLAAQVGLAPEGQFDLPRGITPDEIFNYIYVVLYCPAYRQRYAAFLRTDFPRIPIPGSRKVFDALAQLGAELVAWHLLEHPGAISIVAGIARSTGATAWFGSDFSLNKVAEKSRVLAELTASTGSARTDSVGKVFINATSGFCNVHQSIWQHTIGGYQVLHKWLDDRRKAGRSLSQDDITHWLRVYAALQATQKLMLLVDEAIEANGGWPGAFSQNHPPPDAATLAAEQMVQKEQLKAQKKVATATKKRADYASPTGASSLFDDLEDMAGAAGGPDRPKSRATPATKAAGGKPPGSAASADGLNDGQVMCAIRRVLASAGSGGLSRDDLIRSTARGLSFVRTSPTLKVALDAAIRRAVRRGIAENSGGVLTVLVKDIDGYDRDHLKAQLLVAIRAAGGTCLKADAPMLLARTLGFARTGPNITAMVETILRSLVGARQVESRGGQIFVLRSPVT